MLFGRSFKNPHIRHVRRSLVDFFLWFIGYYKETPPQPAPKEFCYPNPEKALNPQEPSVEWVGHCSFVIRIANMTVLTDPVWSDYCSPLPFGKLKRLEPPPYPIDRLCQVDIVLISHNHYDHLDRRTIEMLASRFPDIIWIVPQNLARWFRRRGIQKVYELGWWQRKTLNLERFAELSVEVTAVPTQHFSGRGLFDKNRTLWCGFVFSVKKGAKKWKSLYFVGDSGYNPHDFAEIGRVFQGFDLSLIPIGTYVPRPFMEPVHIDPEKAVRIHKEVGSKLSIGMHHRTFKLSEEPLCRPPYDLMQAVKEAQVDPLTFRVVRPGQLINW